ncbi:MAG: hypothetical protein GY933_07805 [Hyphomicrobiales bacterium]|nr:hypothetical protein [Hyphomicrobiales bacterium]
MSIVLSEFKNLTASVTDNAALQPAVRGQNRLEGAPRAEDFSRSLRAEARDPIWYLTRQWQFGEFRGDDAGSPIDARIKMRKRVLSGFAPRGRSFGPMPGDLPLETVVEREAVPVDLVTLRQIVAAMRRGLQAEQLSPGGQDAVLGFLRGRFPFDAGAVEGQPDAGSRAQLRLARAHLFDGMAFLGEIRAGAFDAAVDAAGLSGVATAAAKAAAVRVAVQFKALYSQPDATLPSSWNEEQIEYQFQCEIGQGRRGDRLLATEYVSGKLDWLDFEYIPPRRGSTLPEETTEVESFIPAAVTFGGMPNPRFWMMEDRHVEFADINAGTTDAGKLLLTEFALTFANDWVMIPIEVAVGSLCEVEGVLVRNVFGESSLVRAVGQGVDDDWQRWSMFGLSTRATAADRRLFVPPATPTLMEPDPDERVVLLRDEMANMCWAVERTVPSQAGGGRAREVTPPMSRQAPEAEAVRFTLGTEPPTNWIPFIPVRQPGSDRDIRLQRARLPGADRKVQGRVLDEPAPYFINEEEFARSGKIVTRGFQRCRWIDGRVVQWIGRRVRVGRGEGSSGLVFDSVDP